MSDGNVYVNQPLRVEFVIVDQDGNPVPLNGVDLTGAVGIKTPKGVTQMVDGTLIGDGSTGELFHQIDADYLSEADDWKFSAKIDGYPATTVTQKVLNWL